jgi:cobalt-zinc-cadmium efflux system membrane fusion protein
MTAPQKPTLSQPLMIAILLLATLLLSAAIWLSAKKNDVEEEHGHAQDSTEHAHAASVTKGHTDEGEIKLTVQQMRAQGLKVASVTTGLIEKLSILPGKLVVNTDQQAHISPNFSGHVEQVNVALGQTVQKGQTLAVLLVPELIDQQANLRMAQVNLALALKDYQREQQLWTQGISAKQDYQRAESAYRQAQISVQALRSRLNALGASDHNNGRFLIKAPISGVISQKDIVVGENVQLANQLFVIEQREALWLEFNVPNQFSGQLQAGQKIDFKIHGSEQIYSAMVQNLTSQADAQTGRLVVRAKLAAQAAALRPNVLVSVLIAQPATTPLLRIPKSAVQTIEGEHHIFVVQSEANSQVHLTAQKVQLGQASSDGQWLEVLSGVSEGQQYIAQGSFLLKSELEKDEAGHEH